MQITYLCQLALFVTGFESSQALLLFGTTLDVPVPLLRIPCEQGFPCIKSLVFDGCWRNDSKSFLLLFVSSCLVGLPHLFPLYHCVSLLLSLIGGRWTITLQFASVSVCFRFRSSQHHSPPRLAVPEQHRFAPPCSFWKEFLATDKSLGWLQGDPVPSCFRFVLLEVAAPHLPAQTGTLHEK